MFHIVYVYTINKMFILVPATHLIAENIERYLETIIHSRWIVACILDQAVKNSCLETIIHSRQIDSNILASATQQSLMFFLACKSRLLHMLWPTQALSKILCLQTAMSFFSRDSHLKIDFIHGLQKHPPKNVP